MTTVDPVGLVGVGELGSVVLRALAAAGRRVVVYDPSPATAAVIAAAGGCAAGSPAEVAAECACVVVAVARLDQVSEVLLADGIYSTIGEGTVVLHSTIDPVSTANLANLAPETSTFIDAPVSFRRTSPPTFLAFVGADAPLDDGIRDVLDSYCHKVVHCGGPGTGQAAKLVNNVMSLGNTAVAAEALTLAEALGVAPETMLAVAQDGSGSSHALATWEQRRTLFTAGPGDDRRRALARKDLEAALHMARTSGVELPLTALSVTRIE
jgi:3-hydroxyisobutyrate dehydrogenase